MNNNLNTIPDDYAIIFEYPMTIQLNGILPIVNNSSNPVNITIGNTGSVILVTIDGNGSYPGLFIPTGNVTIQNMNFQNLVAKGGDGGNGISGGGGGMGAGGAIYVPQTFLNGSAPSVTLSNVSIQSCSAVGGNGGNGLSSSFTGNEGGGGGGGFGGNGGSILAVGQTGGAGGGGFGGDGGSVTLSMADVLGGGGGGGGGLGSRANIGSLTNLGHGGSDHDSGMNGNGYGLSISAGSGGGGYGGGNNAGGGGGGGSVGGLGQFGGGGGGSFGENGLQAHGDTPPFKKRRRQDVSPSGGRGGDGAGGGGGGIVTMGAQNGNHVSGQAGNGGYGGGGGGGAGIGAYETGYTVQGGSGGIGGGGGGGGVNQSGSTSAAGGNSHAGGGGGGGGPSSNGNEAGGSDLGKLGGGSGGVGASSFGSDFGGGGGGGGSALGAAIFVDSGLNLTLQALPGGIPTVFNTSNNTTVAGLGGTGGPGASNGLDGAALGNSIFLRTGSSLTLMAQASEDLLTLGDQVGFADDTLFGAGETRVSIKGNGTVVYNGTTDYQGNMQVDNANFKVNGLIETASVSVCRNSNFSAQRGTLSGIGTITGNVFVNSGTVSPDAGQTLHLGSLHLNSGTEYSLGSLVHININSSGTSSVSVAGSATLAGILEINLEPNTAPGSYTILTSTEIQGTFDQVKFIGNTPNYMISYLPAGAPTYVQFDFLGYVDIPATVNGSLIFSPALVYPGRPVLLGTLPVPGSGPTIYTITNQTAHARCEIKQTETQTYLKIYGEHDSCTITATKDGIVSNPFIIKTQDSAIRKVKS